MMIMLRRYRQIHNYILTHVASCALASSVVGSHLVQMGYGFYLLFLPGDATDGKDLLSDPLIAPRSAVGKQPPFCRRHRAAPFTTSVASSNIHREKSSITRRWQQSPPPSLCVLPPPPPLALSLLQWKESCLSHSLINSRESKERRCVTTRGTKGGRKKNTRTRRWTPPIFNDLFRI